MRAALLATGLAVAFLGTPASAQHAEGSIPDVPSGSAAIEGRVVHPRGPAAASGVEMVLYALRSGTLPGARQTTSDEAGHFVFDGLSNAPDVIYLVGARYQDVPFPGDRVEFAPGEERRSVDVRIADLTRDPKSVVVRESRLRLDWAGGRVRVHETHHIENRGSRAFYVPEEERSSARPGFRATLPEGATDFEMPMSMVPEGLVRDDARLSFFGPFYPGEQKVSFDYALPAHSGAAQATKVLPAGARRVVVLVPDEGPSMAVDRLAETEPEEIEGRRYRRFEASDFAPGASLALALDLPETRTDPDALRMTETQIFLEFDDAAVLAREVYRLEASGDALLVGSEAEPLLVVPLPDEARELRFSNTSLALGLTTREEGGLAVLGPVTPGENVLELVYQLPVENGHVSLERRFGKELPLLSVYLADTGLRADSERLHRRRPVRSGDRIFIHLEGFALEPGEPVRLELAALPARRGAPRGAAVLLVLVAALGAAALLVAPLRRSGAQDETVMDAPEDPAQREREALYAAIQDLDHDFETGKIAEEDYGTLRDDLRGRAVAVLRAEREAAAARAPVAASSDATSLDAEPPAVACRGCGTPPRPGDRFCARCGQPLEPGDDAEHEVSA